MKFTILTLFPEMFEGVLGHSIVKRAIDQQTISVSLVNFREYTTDRHHTVDDAPFGGGAGMLLKPAPLFEAMDDVRKRDSPSRVLLMSPQGRRFDQGFAQELSQEPSITMVCGHYEGFDERVRQAMCTDEVSIGDFVLTGGEIPAMAVMDAVVRLIPGVLGNDVSADIDSFSSGLLEYPQYTRPAVYREMAVPATLLSGNHAKIEEWRHRHALYRTWARRPDLLRGRVLTDQERSWIENWDAGRLDDIDV